MNFVLDQKSEIVNQPGLQTNSLENRYHSQTRELFRRKKFHRRTFFQSREIQQEKETFTKQRYRFRNANISDYNYVANKSTLIVIQCKIKGTLLVQKKIQKLKESFAKGV